MSRCYRSLLIVCGLSTSALAVEGLEDVSQKIAAKWDAVKSMTASIELNQQSGGSGMTMQMEMTGRMEGLIDFASFGCENSLFIRAEGGHPE